MWSRNSDKYIRIKLETELALKENWDIAYAEDTEG
jgi:hypothetical protein